MKTRGLLGFFPMLFAAVMGGATVPKFRGSNYAMGGYNPMFIPKHTKFKGYMRDHSTFNKTK